MILARMTLLNSSFAFVNKSDSFFKDGWPKRRYSCRSFASLRWHSIMTSIYYSSSIIHKYSNRRVIRILRFLWMMILAKLSNRIVSLSILLRESRKSVDVGSTSKLMNLTGVCTVIMSMKIVFPAPNRIRCCSAVK